MRTGRPPRRRSKKPNAFGLHDMHGNVSEWVEDCFHPNYEGAPADGKPWMEETACYRVVRGGSWAYVPGSLRSAIRYGVPSDFQYNFLGFRVARTLSAGAGAITVAPGTH